MKATTTFFSFFSFFLFSEVALGQQAQGQQKRDFVDIDDVVEQVVPEIFPPSFDYEADGIIFFDLLMVGSGGYGDKGGSITGELAFEAFFRIPGEKLGFLLNVGAGTTRIRQPLEGGGIYRTFGLTNSMTVGFGNRSKDWDSRHLGFFKFIWVYDSEMYNFGCRYLAGYRYERDFSPGVKKTGTAFGWTIGVQGGYEEYSYFRKGGWVVNLTLGLVLKF